MNKLKPGSSTYALLDGKAARHAALKEGQYISNVPINRAARC
ncbi:hypothetical protein [Gibbsiella quercinecans]|nr:hypothetical protein [Gibbsiella quercinecans]